MGKCPYCSKELHLEDFFEVSKMETKKEKLKGRIRDFKGESVQPYRRGRNWGECKMWVCPSCNTILGFTEFRHS